MKVIAILCFTVDVHQEHISADGCRTDGFMQPMKMSEEEDGVVDGRIGSMDSFTSTQKRQGALPGSRKRGNKETQVPLRTITCSETQWDRTPR